MNNFNKGSRFSDRKSDSSFGRQDFRNRGSNRQGGSFSRPTMHKAICAECGQSCEVPFKPTGDKPVFCSNCFRGKENRGGRGDSRGDKRNISNISSDNSQIERQFQIINEKLDKILQNLPLSLPKRFVVKEKAVIKPKTKKKVVKIKKAKKKAVKKSSK